MSCRGFLQWILKILNFFLALVGALIVLYSLWMLNQWFKRTPSPTPAPAPAEEYTSTVGTLTGLPVLRQPLPTVEGQETQMVATLSFAMERATRLGLGLKLPTPWFIYAFLGIGIIVCFVTCVGHIAGETANSCCLCFYTILLALLLVVQAAVTAIIFFDDHWHEDFPADATGEWDRVYKFVIENYDILKWVALALLIVQGLALLFSLILRAVAGSRRSGYDSDDDYLPVAHRQTMQRQTTNAGNNGGGDTASDKRPSKARDEWSKRMREKYGLDTTEFTYNPSESRRVPQQAGTATSSGEEKKGGCCSIM